MKKYALGVAVATVGLATQSISAHADKLDDVWSRLGAIEKHNAQLASENAALKARLNKVESTKSGAPIVMAAPAGRAATPAKAAAALEGPEIDANGHGYLEHKKGTPLTFYTPGGEITAYGNFDISIDDTSKSIGNFDLNGHSPPIGNFGWLPAIASNTSYLGVRGFQRLPHFPAHFVYQVE